MNSGNKATQTREVLQSCAEDDCLHRLPAVGTLPHGVYCAEHGCRLETREGQTVKCKECER